MVLGKAPPRLSRKVGPELSIWVESDHILVFYFSALSAPGPAETTLTTKAMRTSFLARSQESALILAIFLFRIASLHLEQSDFFFEELHVYKSFHLPLMESQSRAFGFRHLGQ